MAAQLVKIFLVKYYLNTLVLNCFKYTIADVGIVI